MKLHHIIVFICCCFTVFPSISLISYQPNYKPVNASQLICLQNSGYLEQFIVIVSQDPQSKVMVPSIQPSQLQKIALLPHIVLLFRDTSSSSMTRYVNYLSKNNYKMLWIFPQGRGSQGPKLTCDQFWNFTNQLKNQIKKPIGIAVDRYTWNDTFGDLSACPKFGIYPLFNYAFGQQKFIPFGGWTSQQFTFQSVVKNKCQIDSIYSVLYNKSKANKLLKTSD